MNKRKLAYLRRYLRVGSILLIILGPLFIWLVLRQAKPYYKNLPTLYTLNATDSLCKELVPAEASLIFLATSNEELKYSLKIYKNLTEQLKDIQKILPPLFVYSADTVVKQENTIKLGNKNFASFLQNCLQIEKALTKFPVVIILKDSKEVAGIYYLGNPFKRKRLKEDISMYLFLQKHPEYEAKQKH